MLINKDSILTTPDDWRRGGKSYDHRGHQIFYRRMSTGPDLLLLHGFPTSSFDWKYLWGDLTNEYRCLALDFIGFGFSDKPVDYAYSIHDQADLVEGLLAHEKIDRACILTHDYGVSVAQELLARYEDRRRAGRPGFEPLSICFLNGGLFPEVHRPVFIQKLLLSPLGGLVAKMLGEKTFRKKFPEVFGPRTKPTDRELQEFWELITRNEGTRIYHKLMGYVRDRRQHRERWVDVLRETAVPLRVVNGPEDPVSGAHMVARYRELIPDPDVVSLPGIGHYPNTEDPNGVLKAFREFNSGR